MAEEIIGLDARRMGTPDGDVEMNDKSEEHNVPISELRKVRAEAAKYRKQLRQLESKIEKEKETVGLAMTEEVNRLKAIAEEAETKANAFKRRSDGVAKQAAIINAASALGFRNPDDAASMVDLGQIDIDNDGTVSEEELNELVKSLAESKPYLIKGQSSMAGFGPTNPPSSNWPKAKLRAKDRVDHLKQQSREIMRTGRMSEAIKLYNQAWEMERGIKRRK